MISDMGPAVEAALPSAFSLGIASPATTTVSDAPLDAETAEQEITRLTWSVLDGSTTLADRQRLAELVKAQHARRHRFDP
jgi:hypothetical protein